MNSPKLDLSTTRIFKNTDEDIIEAMSLIGQEVYVSDDKDLEYYQRCELVGVRKVKNDPLCYLGKTSDDSCSLGYKYFILAEYAVFVEEVKKEKTLRPFKDIGEFANETCCEELGTSVISIRNKVSNLESVLLYTGYSDDIVCLGGYIFTFADLLKKYEFLYEDKWLPFGIEVDE